MSKTLFERIIAREIPAKIEHEDELCIVLHDIQPQAPVHLLIIPKKALPRIGAATNDDQVLLGHLLLTAGNLAKKLQLANGFRLVVNNGPDGGESVPHLHVHLLARRPLTWPPG
ncbi:MAG: histidine triad nucleotide-binding protein [Opitutaceae bacterium]|nr:histidine triad nucleotide-binding protein [Opitutaceae bacterium]